MGYKSTLRSLSAASNAATRDHEKKQKRLQREQERLKKKITKLEEKKSKITDSLNELLAKGKISGKKHKELLKRESEITLDLLVFGKSAIIPAAKRYICGSIEKKEFESLCKSIIPDEVFKERQEIIDNYNKLIESIKNFKNSCKKRENECYKCAKKKGIFSPLSNIEDMKLCGRCKGELRDLLNYKGKNGTYFYVTSHIISLNDINKPQLQINIQQNHF